MLRANRSVLGARRGGHNTPHASESEASVVDVGKVQNNDVDCNSSHRITPAAQVTSFVILFTNLKPIHGLCLDCVYVIP
jgi:hypothetical protein